MFKKDEDEKRVKSLRTTNDAQRTKSDRNSSLEPWAQDELKK